MLTASPGPCPICGAAHHACKPAGDSGGEGVGVTRGVIVRERDAGTVVLPAVQTSAHDVSEMGE